MARKLAAGNWKMNGLNAHLAEISELAGAIGTPGVDVLICPPAPLIARMKDIVGSAPIAIGGQDCHPNEKGAHTGDISAPMLADAGASHVILGHSERRADHGESDALISDKAVAAAAAGLLPIICVGETLAERQAGNTLDVVGSQLSGSVPRALTDVVIAYEPVWAIGTGEVATVDQIAEVHAFIRAELTKMTASFGAADVPILYGGSVKAGSAAEIFAVPDVDGGLVGGASLKAADFAPIVAALDAA